MESSCSKSQVTLPRSSNNMPSLNDSILVRLLLSRQVFRVPMPYCHPLEFLSSGFGGPGVEPRPPRFDGKRHQEEAEACFLSLSMFILGRTSAFQNRVFIWKTIPHSPKTIGMIVCRFQSLLTCWNARDGAPVLKLYYQTTTKIQTAAGDGRSSAKVVLLESEHPAGHRRWPLQY